MLNLIYYLYYRSYLQNTNKNKNNKQYKLEIPKNNKKDNLKLN